MCKKISSKFKGYAVMQSSGEGWDKALKTCDVAILYIMIARTLQKKFSEKAK